MSTPTFAGSLRHHGPDSELGSHAVSFPSTSTTTFAHAALTQVTVSGNAAYTPTKIVARDFYAAMAAHCAHSSLHGIRIGGEYGDVTSAGAEEIELYSVGADILQPLFSFANLRTVSLEHPVGFDLDVAAVVQMARSWPRLEHLSPKAKPFHDRPSRVTLEGISAFAEHCLSLHTLAIMFERHVRSETSPDHNDASSGSGPAAHS
ncbi:hypothetical protein DFH09DRAFT_1408342 [Mycena vulgaris]|nr:hypothetical protein DFH09DRAFT_1408342 [Mycena vulgaris]